MLSLINVGDWLNKFKAFQRITFNYVPLNSIQVLECGDSLHNIKPGSATADNKISLELVGMGCNGIIILMAKIIITVKEKADRQW